MTLPQLFVLGDSISIQYGPALQRAVAGVFNYSRKEGIDDALANLDVPAGANGGDSHMCLAYVNSLPTSWHADVFLLNCGLHDVKRIPGETTLQVAIDRYEANLEQLLDAIDARADHTVWVRTTPIDEAQHNTGKSSIHRLAIDVDAYNAVSDRVMQRRGVPMIDLHRFSLSLGVPGDILHDGRHFHEPIRERQGAYISGWLAGWWSAGV